MGKNGFIFILPLILVTTAAFVSAVAVVKVRSYDNNLQLRQLAAEKDLGNLAETKVVIGQLKEQIVQAKQKGIDVSSIEFGFTNLTEFIKEKDFKGLESTISSYSAEINDLILQKEAADLKKVTDLKNSALAKAADYKNKGVDVTGLEKQIVGDVSQLIDVKDFSKAIDKLYEITKNLDQLYTKKIETDRAVVAEAAKKAVAQQASTKVTAGSGYERKTINTARGSFVVDLVTINLTSGVRVITETANDSDCFDACLAKPLASYVSDNGGFAGINGTYFCPPDYSSCAGKVNTFDLPVINSRLGKFINNRTLFWNDRGMIAFDGSNKVNFFADAKNFSGSYRAAIANFPTLISGGANVVNEGGLDNKQRTAKINRGGIANKGNTLYLMVAKAATVGDLAAIMQTMGVDNGLNLDGGGSSALYYGGYKVGPGRSLPNAIVIAQ